MGGRLDATNIVVPLISVITDISLDHMEWLGSTIAAITREKAGILRRGGTLITLPQHRRGQPGAGRGRGGAKGRGVNGVPYMPAMRALRRTRLYRVETLGAQIEVASPLHGAHQQRNVALAIAAAVELAVSTDFR